MRSVPFLRIRQETERVYSEPFRRRKTWKKIDLVLRELNAVGLKTSADISPALIGRWLREFPRKQMTAYSLLRSFRAVCSLCKSQGWVDNDPFDFRKPASWLPEVLDPFDDDETTKDRHRSAEQIARLFELIDREAKDGGWKEARLQALIYTYAFLGLRKNEALQLRREDLDTVGKTVRVRSRKGRRLKTKSSRATLVLPDELAEVLRSWLARCGSDWVFPGMMKVGPWTGGPPGHKPLDCVKAAGLRAGICGLTILDFRHTIATLAEQWGWGELELMRWLRHNRPTTQSWYRKAPDLAGLRASAATIRFK